MQRPGPVVPDVRPQDDAAAVRPQRGAVGRVERNEPCRSDTKSFAAATARFDMSRRRRRAATRPAAGRVPLHAAPPSRSRAGPRAPDRSRSRSGSRRPRHYRSSRSRGWPARRPRRGRRRASRTPRCRRRRRTSSRRRPRTCGRGRTTPARAATSPCRRCRRLNSAARDRSRGRTCAPSRRRRRCGRRARRMSSGPRGTGIRLVDRVRREGHRGALPHGACRGTSRAVCAPRFESSTPHTTPWGVWLTMTCAQINQRVGSPRRDNLIYAPTTTWPQRGRRPCAHPALRRWQRDSAATRPRRARCRRGRRRRRVERELHAEAGRSSEATTVRVSVRASSQSVEAIARGAHPRDPRRAGAR